MNNEPKSRPIQDEGEMLKVRQYVMRAVRHAYETKLLNKYCIVDLSHTMNAAMSDLHDSADAAWIDAATRLGYFDTMVVSPPAAQPEPTDMCICGHEREAHFDFGCGCETERDVSCECKEFRLMAEAPSPQNMRFMPCVDCGKDLRMCECKPLQVDPIRALVDEQAEDGGLWFVAETITEDYLQRALRKLHAVIENLKPAQPESQPAAFEEWWEIDQKLIFPETADVLKEWCEHAWNAAIASKSSQVAGGVGGEDSQ